MRSVVLNPTPTAFCRRVSHPECGLRIADGSVFPATEYWRDQNQLLYVSGANKGTVALRDIDWSVTTRLNSARNVRVLLRSVPAQN